MEVLQARKEEAAERKTNVQAPGTKFAFLDPYGIIFQIKISTKPVVYLLYNLQFQVVLRWIEL